MHFSKWLVLAGVVSGLHPAYGAASLICEITAAPVTVRSEGITEQLGDILFACRNGDSNGAVTTSLGVSLPVNITNRVTAGNVLDAVLTVDTGNGPVSAGATPILGSSNVVTFMGIHFALSPAGTASLRISGIRAAIAQLGQGVTSPVVATISWGGGSPNILFTQATATVGIPRAGLFAGTASTLVNCHGSALPSVISVGTLFSAGTALSSTRLTEGFSSAFEAGAFGIDTGTRFILRYSGFPASAQIFVPDAVTGSDAAEPTASGLMGGYKAAGVYVAQSRTLLLVRIDKTDANGKGGYPLFTMPFNGASVLNGATEVKLTNGAGIAVYEVADSNPVGQESVEIPTWLGLPATGGAASAPTQSITFGPVSDVVVATATDPVPRFASVAPETDCALKGDCGSFPQLKVNAPALEYTAESGEDRLHSRFSVTNPGGGTLAWAAYVTYKNGSGWASVAREAPSVRGGGWMTLYVAPQNLAPGIYEATLSIDGGPVGLENLPVKLTVIPVGSGDPKAPAVTGIVHAATFAYGAMVPGSLATVWGTHMAGSTVSVSFDSHPARLLYTSDRQINLEVPAELSGTALTRMTVTTDGRSSGPRLVNLTPISPGIFGGGILNEDGSVNSTTNPAAGGSVIRVLATGLPSSAAIGTITAKLNNLWITSFDYAGPASGLIGVQEVRLRVPEGLGPMSTPVVVCGIRNMILSVRTCSPQATVTLK